MAGRAAVVTGLFLLAGISPAAAGEKQGGTKAGEVGAAVRGMIEPAYRKNTGLGFKSFACPGARPSSGFLDCDAIDDEGDALRYTLKVDAEGNAEVILVSQPAAAMTAKDKSILEPACRAFLKAYGAGDWAAVYATLHPDLQRELTRDQMKERLDPVRSSLGAVRSADLTSYSRRVPDQHELQYALAAARGPGLARFRVDPDAAKVTAFMVTARPGSPLHASMLEPALRGLLAGMIGRPVERLDAPLDRLAATGDAVEATARLAGGREVPLRLVHSGRPDDFDPMDYTAELLDAALLIERSLASRGGAAVQSVDCPSRVVADGGTLTCRAALAGGKRLAVTIARRGGSHRIVEEKAIPD